MANNKKPTTICCGKIVKRKHIAAKQVRVSVIPKTFGKTFCKPGHGCMKHIQPAFNIPKIARV